ncbi:MAG: pseudouridine synthase [Thermodesulfobacterium geofontis]|uniref:Pseudouridine synthase n=1 Tax=Thermodesulfobacterium geofontis TaxID=1295609 RepID=A0A2N7PNX2_9BACT|nr:MAG: pseudouridine synthase [Thermodesulfobacterium geofontis]
MRLNKFLSFCGIASRRKAEKLILSGKVSVNGQVIRDLSYKINPEKDKVYINGKLIIPPPKVYYLFYKPKGVLTSLYDPHHKETLRPFLEKLPFKVFPVGRLDKYSEGLILLTNDGELANLLLHPRYEVKRVYRVWVAPKIEEEKIKTLFKSGIIIENKLIKPLNFNFLKKDKDKWIYEITVKEGVKREVRRIIDYLGGKVHRLIRIKFGPLSLVNLKPGEIRPLSKKEYKELLLFVSQLKNSKILDNTSSAELT